MALAALPRYCASCAVPIHPGAPYVVTPDVAGVGPDTITCLECDAVGRACIECEEPIRADESIVCSACWKDED